MHIVSQVSAAPSVYGQVCDNYYSILMPHCDRWSKTITHRSNRAFNKNITILSNLIKRIPLSSIVPLKQKRKKGKYKMLRFRPPPLPRPSVFFSIGLGSGGGWPSFSFSRSIKTSPKKKIKKWTERRVGWVFWRGCKEKGGMAMSSGSFQSFSFISRRIFDMSNRESTSARRHTHKQDNTLHNKSKRKPRTPPPLHAIWFKCWNRSIISNSATLHDYFTIIMIPDKTTKRVTKMNTKKTKNKKRAAKINETDKGRISNRWPQFSSWHNKKETSERKTGRKEKNWITQLT